MYDQTDEQMKSSTMRRRSGWSLTQSSKVSSNGNTNGNISSNISNELGTERWKFQERPVIHDEEWTADSNVIRDRFNSSSQSKSFWSDRSSACQPRGRYWRASPTSCMLTLHAATCIQCLVLWCHDAQLNNCGNNIQERPVCPFQSYSQKQSSFWHLKCHSFCTSVALVTCTEAQYCSKAKQVLKVIFFECR